MTRERQRETKRRRKGKRRGGGKRNLLGITHLTYIRVPDEKGHIKYHGKNGSEPRIL